MQGKRAEGSRKQQGRLPVIAPKDDSPSSSTPSRSLSSSTANIAAPHRSRLPPRSRNGCWYAALMLFVTQCGLQVFSGLVGSASTTTFPNLEDILPPFSSLTTDEDRERKAETSSPGTYHVVVNPDSFIHLPEYSERSREPSIPRSSSLRRNSLALSAISAAGREARAESSDFMAEDDTTVIIHRFEDTSRRGTFSGKPSESPLLPKVAVKTENSINSEDVETNADQDDSLVSIAAGGGQDSELLEHFRYRIVPQVMQFETHQKGMSSSDIVSPGARIFEEAAMISQPVSTLLN
ncbi:MAG: hypothetical protein Q9227_006046 [Pyrenula ochraceoflavens]